MDSRQQHWTQHIDNGYLYKRQFFRHGTANRRQRTLGHRQRRKHNLKEKADTRQKKRNNETRNIL